MNRIKNLKENYRNILINWIDEDYNREYVAYEIVSESDKFAIDFAEWYLDLWNRNDLSFDKNSPKELLEIYKKEK
ncbi:hypothetical protein [Flavobacterium sp. WC2416]|uniref:Uncharacterized protein n=1 Tax=Flavobacterium sp. WC2416 TaxID=3234141 RepID=A0AB39W7C6_9FLAO